MFEAIKGLIDSGLLNEEAQSQIEQAWQNKLVETREQLAVEMRAEFANRYEHDKNKMVQAMDQMVTENLSRELHELAEEKAEFAKIKAKHVAEMQTKARAVDAFIAEALQNEINELHEDRKRYSEGLNKLESFVSEGIAAELREFAQDKQDLARTKVKLVSEARDQLLKLKQDFVARSSVALNKAVTENLKAEIGQLREDITQARENNFGRRLFEAFASEFSATHLNENAEMRKLKIALAEKNQALAEAQTAEAAAKHLAESKQAEIVKINENIEREKKLTNLLRSLSKEKAEVMTSLLESVQTDRLEAAFNKYLPAVIEASTKSKKVLNENTVSEKTGDRQARVVNEPSEQSNIIELKRLAGLQAN